MGHIKMIQSGRMVEVFEYERDINRSRPFGRKPRKLRIGDIKTRVFRRDNSARQKKAFRRLVTANIGGDEVCSLVTLTMLEVVPLRAAERCLVEFVKRLRRTEGKGFRYIGVPEFQKRGAVHYHLIIWGIGKRTIETEYETRYLQGLWTRGFVDCVVTDGSPKLVGYLSKYLSKSLSDKLVMGSKAYMCSNNVLRPVSLSTKTSAFHAAKAWDIDLDGGQALLDREFQTQWLGKGRYRLFEI